MGKVCVIVAAAGKGSRMGAKQNKQFLKIKNKPILYYTLRAFDSCSLVDEVILVTAKEEEEYCRNEIIAKYHIQKVSCIAHGGSERQNSVYNGLRKVAQCEIVLIHDGARPFVSDKIIREGIEYARKFGACTCGVTPKDTIKVKDESSFSKSTLDRESLFVIQTPQCFKYDLIMECHEKISSLQIGVTDDTSIIEHFGHKVFLYEGSYNNIKITTPEDLIIGEKILETLKLDEN